MELARICVMVEVVVCCFGQTGGWWRLVALVRGLVFPWVVGWGVCWGVHDMWVEDQSLGWEFGEHGNCCMG